MKPQEINQADYLDILYDNRNKQYGGYALRKNHHKRMNKALLLMLLFCTAFVAMGMIPEGKHIETDLTEHFSQKEVNLADIIPPPITPPPPPPAPQPPTHGFTPPVVVRDTVPIELVIDIDSLEGVGIGPVTTTGKSNGTSTVSKTNGSATGVKTVEPPKPKIWDYVSDMPTYKGNIYAYIGKELRYPQAAVDTRISGQVLIQFVISETGAVEDAKVVRGIGSGCDEEALRVIKNMPAWVPGSQNGVPVKVQFTLPIKFILE